MRSFDGRETGCPLVLDFHDRGVSFEPAARGARFDAGGSSPACETSDWPSPETPWLVRDLDGNGAIDGSHELFGTGTRLPDGTLAPNGFAALEVLDEDGDGWITPEDSAWPTLGLWFDRDRDRRTGPGELSSLDELGVVGISLGYTIDPQCDPRGNCAIERAPFGWVGADGRERVGRVIDVHLNCRGEG